MRRVQIIVLAVFIVAAFVGQTARVMAASPADGDGADNSSATFSRSDTSGASTNEGDSILATFFVATGDGTYVCILHPQWGALTAPVPPN